MGSARSSYNPSSAARHSAIPDHKGDVLILHTESSFKTFAVGPVLDDGQQGFEGRDGVRYFETMAEAVEDARRSAGAGACIYELDIDTGRWSRVDLHRRKG